jgi:hypothetical protein
VTKLGAEFKNKYIGTANGIQKKSKLIRKINNLIIAEVLVILTANLLNNFEIIILIRVGSSIGT